MTNINYEQKWKIEGVVSKEVKAEIDRCRSLLSRKYPNGVDYNTLQSDLAELYMKRNDPERKHNRRKKRVAKKTPEAKPAPTITHSRHIPARVKNQVWTRDKGRCTFRAPNGEKCGSTYNLQFDHYPVPFARGGPNTPDNLRLLCARHNRHTAEQGFGKRDYNNRSP